jgi:FHA domain-containing protein
VGRDPSSDLVLNDPKCSRQHAVIEVAGGDIVIRDNGSANGILVNGAKAERARLREGDIVKLGDVVISLVSDSPGTLVVGDLDFRPSPRPAGYALDATAPEVPASEIPRPAIRKPPVLGAVRATREVATDATPASSGVAGQASGGRPLTVTVLVALWGLSVPLYAIAGAVLSSHTTGGLRVVLFAAGIALASLAGAMAAGLWLGRRWAYVAQIATGAVGVFFCPFTLASIAVLIYMLRPSVQWHFSAGQEKEPDGGRGAEPMFAGAMIAAVVLGVLVTAALTFFAGRARTVAGAGGARGFMRSSSAERGAVAQLTALATAEEAFHSVCNTGYGDLEALRQPATVIPDYVAGGPAFLRDAAFDRPERDGYRYTLKVEDQMPPAPGCPTRRFRRFFYSAAPTGDGRWLAVGSDGVVRAAEARPATPDDPAVQ